MMRVTEGTVVQPFQVETRDVPSYCLMIEDEEDGKPWYYDIKRYIQHREYPPGISEVDKRTIRRLVMSFFLNGERFYKTKEVTILCY
jgi:hypothetical protein